MSAATLNGSTVTYARVHIAKRGVPHAIVEANTPTELADGTAVTLVVGDLTLAGTIVSGGSVGTRTVYRIVAGAGGWGREVPAKAYTNDLGVKHSTIALDAAQACGETMGTIPAGSVGPHYVRAEGIAARTLDDLFPGSWYVDLAGVTQVGARAATTYTGGATRTSRDHARGWIELAADSIAALLPGAVVDGMEAVDVEHILDGKLRTIVWGARTSEASDRVTAALAAHIDARTDHHRFFAPWRYRVVQRTGERYDLQVVRVSSGMPDLRLVRVRPGVAGMRSRPMIGSHVLVSFIDGDPAQPVISACDDYDSPGFVASAIYLQAGSTGTNAGVTEHATSAQSLVLFVYEALLAMGAVIAPTPVTPAQVKAAIATALGLMSTDTLDSIDVVPGTTKAAIDALLAAKTADTTGKAPSLGWPNVRGG